MNKKLKQLLCTAVICAATLVGCAETSLPTATGKGSIRGINAIVDSPELTFRIERVSLGATTFRAVAGFAEYDDLTYDFNFDVFLPGEVDPVVVATQFIDVMVDVEYTLVATGSYDNAAVVVWENPERIFAEGATEFEIEFMHHAPTQGPVDIYFQAPGTAPALGNAAGTIANNERIPLAEYAGGDFRLIVTPEGDPSTILLESETLTSVGGTRIAIVVFDPDPAATSTISVNLINAGGISAPLYDVNSASRLRLIHGDIGNGNIDAFLDDDFSTAAFPNIPYAGTSDYVNSDLTLVPTTITTAGNVGNILVDTDISLTPNASTTGILGRDGEDNVLIKRLQDNARSVAAFPVYRITNMSVNASPLDIFVLDAGTAITDDLIPEFFDFPVTGDTGFIPAPTGMIELTATRTTEFTPISNVLALDNANGDVVDIAILDTTDPNVVEIVVITPPD